MESSVCTEKNMVETWLAVPISNYLCIPCRIYSHGASYSRNLIWWTIINQIIELKFYLPRIQKGCNKDIQGLWTWPSRLEECWTVTLHRLQSAIMKWWTLPPNIKHPLRNHGLVGKFHIIGTIYGVFNLKVMGLYLESWFRNSSKPCKGVWFWGS